MICSALHAVFTGEIQQRQLQSERRNAMNTLEASKILAVLNASYSRKICEEDAMALIKLWSEIFIDIPYSEVGGAIMEFIKNDTKGFMPLPGQIMELVECRRARKICEQIEQTFADRLETVMITGGEENEHRNQ